MRDGIALEKEGTPSVVLVHDVFDAAAKAQARALGIPELNIVTYVQPRAQALEAEEAQKAQEVAARLPEVLIRKGPSPKM